MRLARHQIADAAFVEPARVVDDQHVAGRRCGDGLEKHVDAAGVARRTCAAGDLHASARRPQMRRPQADRQLEHRTAIGDERRRPLEVFEKGCDHLGRRLATG